MKAMPRSVSSFKSSIMPRLVVVVADEGASHSLHGGAAAAAHHIAGGLLNLDYVGSKDSQICSREGANGGHAEVQDSDAFHGETFFDAHRTPPD